MNRFLLCARPVSAVLSVYFHRVEVHTAEAGRTQRNLRDQPWEPFDQVKNLLRSAHGFVRQVKQHHLDAESPKAAELSG